MSSGVARMSRTPACEASSMSGITSGASIDHGWMWTWTSKTFMVPSAECRLPRMRIVVALGPPSPQHHQPHADGRVGTGALEFTGAEELWVDFVAVDGLESPPLDIRLGGRGEEVELAQAAGGQPVEELAHEPPPDSVSAILRLDRDRADERRELIRLRPSATDDLLPRPRHDERAPVLVHPLRGEVVRNEQLLDSRQILRHRRTDVNLFVTHGMRRGYNKRATGMRRARTRQGRSSNIGTCRGRTTVKCRRSNVATALTPSLSASATTDASTVPSGRSWYRATSS